ncbi:hypothetical protein R3P38DRAFT_2889468 [Favolaschia claudopus]|uniref:Transmembrane protein n=1 Tax=Favolaschia claudopus TaxID=2862362 RepID=A0AAW0CU48_9AGAR
MNRLRKTSETPKKSTVSATSLTSSPRPLSADALVVRPSLKVTAASATLQTDTTYWAARALKAETLLAARVEHHRELRSLSFVEETKRARERNAHDARHAKLEKLVLVLLVMLVLLVLALLHLAHKSTSKSRSRKLPFHFTIPILSPFTSVTLTALSFVFAGLAYFTLRHWMARRR